MKNTRRLSLLSLALSLSLLTTVLSTSAALVEAKDMKASFVVDSSSVFGIELNGNEYKNETILPGQTIDLSPTVTNNSTMPVYVFAEISLPDDFTVDDMSSSWTQLPTEDDSIVYYLGDTSGLSELAEEGSSLIFKTITLNSDIIPPLTDEDPLTYDVQVTVNAIQASGFENRTPAEVWEVAR